MTKARAVRAVRAVPLRRHIEKQLWRKVFSGDERALEELLMRLDPVIRAESRVNGSVNEEVAQEIREKLFVEIRKRQFNQSERGHIG